MKRLTALLMVCAVCFAECGTQEAQNSVEETQESIFKALPLPKLYLEIPERFSTTSSEFYEEYYICDDASIIVTEDTKDAPYKSVYDYSVSALVEYQNITTEFELLHEELIEAGPIGVQVMEFNYGIGEGDSIIRKTCMVGYLTDSDSMYIITCKSDTDTYEGFRDDFISVLSSAAFVQ